MYPHPFVQRTEGTGATIHTCMTCCQERYASIHYIGGGYAPVQR